MKPVLLATGLVALFPVAALAAGDSPQAQCLAKAEKDDQAVVQRLAELEARQPSPPPLSQAEKAHLSFHQSHSTGNSSMDSSITETAKVLRVHPDFGWRATWTAERYFIARRKTKCMELPDASAMSERRASVGRGGATVKTVYTK